MVGNIEIDPIDSEICKEGSKIFDDIEEKFKAELYSLTKKLLTVKDEKERVRIANEIEKINSSCSNSLSEYLYKALKGGFDKLQNSLRSFHEKKAKYYDEIKKIVLEVEKNCGFSFDISNLEDIVREVCIDGGIGKKSENLVEKIKRSREEKYEKELSEKCTNVYNLAREKNILKQLIELEKHNRVPFTDELYLFYNNLKEEDVVEGKISIIEFEHYAKVTNESVDDTKKLEESIRSLPFDTRTKEFKSSYALMLERFLKDKERIKKISSFIEEAKKYNEIIKEYNSRKGKAEEEKFLDKLSEIGANFEGELEDNNIFRNLNHYEEKYDFKV